MSNSFMKYNYRYVTLVILCCYGKLTVSFIVNLENIFKVSWLSMMFFVKPYSSIGTILQQISLWIHSTDESLRLTGLKLDRFWILFSMNYQKISPYTYRVRNRNCPPAVVEGDTVPVPHLVRQHLIFFNDFYD